MSFWTSPHFAGSWPSGLWRRKSLFPISDNPYLLLLCRALGILEYKTLVRKSVGSNPTLLSTDAQAPIIFFIAGGRGRTATKKVELPSSNLTEQGHDTKDCVPGEGVGLGASLTPRQSTTDLIGSGRKEKESEKAARTEERGSDRSARGAAAKPWILGQSRRVLGQFTHAQAMGVRSPQPVADTPLTPNTQDDRFCYHHVADSLARHLLDEEDEKLGWDLPDDGELAQPRRRTKLTPRRHQGPSAPPPPLPGRRRRECVFHPLPYAS